MPAGDITISANWTEKPSEYVEIVFGKKNLSESEAKEVIERYADTKDFTIIRTEDVGSGETRVIVKFIDATDATSFIETISSTSDTQRRERDDTALANLCAQVFDFCAHQVLKAAERIWEINNVTSTYPN